MVHLFLFQDLFASIDLHPNPEDFEFLSDWCANDFPMCSPITLAPGPEPLLDLDWLEEDVPHPNDPPPIILLVAVRSPDCPVDKVTDTMPSGYMKLEKITQRQLESPFQFMDLMVAVKDKLKQLMPYKQLVQSKVNFTLESPRKVAPLEHPKTVHSFYNLLADKRDGVPHMFLFDSPQRHHLLIVSFALKVHEDPQPSSQLAPLEPIPIIDFSRLPLPFDPAFDPPPAVQLTWTDHLRYLAKQPPSFDTMKKFLDLAHTVHNHYEGASALQYKKPAGIVKKVRTYSNRKQKLVAKTSTPSSSVFTRLGLPQPMQS